jgi:single-strand DNA-binding protein
VRDVEVRYTQSGKAVASFTLAVNKRFKREGEQQADFVPVVAWDKLAEICGQYLAKGYQAIVEGRLQIRSYDAQDGTKKYVTEVIANNVEFVGSKKVATEEETQANNGSAENTFGKTVPDEDIPF